MERGRKFVKIREDTQLDGDSNLAKFSVFVLLFTSVPTR